MNRLGNIVNSKTKVKIKCLKDDHEWFVKPNQLSNGSGCPKCSGNIKLTNEELKTLVHVGQHSLQMSEPEKGSLLAQIRNSL